MKVKIVLNGKTIETFKGTAEKLIEMGRAHYPGAKPKDPMTKEEFLKMAEKKTDQEAENRKTKVVEPEENKIPDVPEEDRTVVHKAKRGRPKKK